MSLIAAALGFLLATPLTPLTLQDAWARGAARNPQLQAAAAESARAATLVKQGRTLFYPVIEARGAMQWNDERIAFDVGPTEFVVQPWWTLNWQVTAQQNLSFHGPGVPLLRQARALADQAELIAAQAGNEVAFAIARAYYSALAAESAARVADEARTAAAELLRVTRGRAEGGRATQVEVLRARLRVAEADQAVAQAKRATEEAQSILGDLIGDPGPFALTRPPRPAAPPAPSAGEDDRAPLPKRPDVLAAMRSADAAEAARSAALRQFYPTVGVQALYAGYQTSDGELFGQSPDRMALIAAVNVPLFDGTLKYWQHREKREAARSARAQAASTLSTATADLRRSRRATATAAESERLAAERLALAESVRELVLGQYTLGAATQLEVLDADAARSAARREAAQAELESDLAILDLQRAMGTRLQ